MAEPDDVDPTIAAAIQAATLAGDYPLAIGLVREHQLTDRCLGCVNVPGKDGFVWQFGGPPSADGTRRDEVVLRTCYTCTEDFARWYVSKSPSRRMFDGALHGTSYRSSLAYAGKPTEEITSRMFHWRVKDALKGKELSPELDANLRPAFEAAWSAAEYEFAYSLLDNLDTLADSYEAP